LSLLLRALEGKVLPFILGFFGLESFGEKKENVLWCNNFLHG
jgi:hypothetical protein